MIRVMVVDDALFMRKVYNDMLSRNQMAVVAEAANGYEAIAKYEECKPDVVLMDITMPGITGEDALVEIVKQDPNAKVIMASAMGQEVFVRRCIAKGAKAFIVKPVVENHMVSLIHSVVGA